MAIFVCLATKAVHIELVVIRDYLTREQVT